MLYHVTDDDMFWSNQINGRLLSGETESIDPTFSNDSGSVVSPEFIRIFFKEFIQIIKST